MATCPHCGFSYAWDGSMCGHCRVPASRTPTEVNHDDWMQARILKKARGHGLPSGQTHRFQHLEPERQESILAVAGDRLRGRPVLAFIDSSARWTLLTTREVISHHGGQFVMMNISDLVFVSNASEPPVRASLEEVGRWKGSWEYLWVEDRNRCEGRLWVPCGGQAYALWNILLHLVRAKREAVPGTEPNGRA